MSFPDKKIVDFIRRHNVLTLATTVRDHPWCANMFYAYDPKENLFVFTSEDKTKHIEQALANNRIAASIVLESKVVGRLQGLQITGIVSKADHGLETSKKIYLKRFPYAAAYPLNLWILYPDNFKFTDNTLGFGKKLFWSRDQN